MKRIWITGGGSGIGKALAWIYADDGWDVFISGRNPNKLKTAADYAPNIHPHPCDITDPDGVAACISAIGDLDVAVLNAGDYRPGPTSETTLDDFRQTMEVNYFGTLNCIQAVLPTLKANAGQLAVVASVAGYIGLPNASGYGPSKAALISLCESLRAELQDSAVTVHLINPGFVKTELTDKNDFEMPNMISPFDAALNMRRGLETDRFEIAFPAPFVRRMKLLKALPYWAYFKLMKKVAGI
ncbi:SDR family NAD(P)-dependent oxidoreductase [Magnetovibrio sp. PR-2]|uniref:SDR family NAD(P)-dependent oxidoreductase n=1 Tax=Magnetovibrio sp. PR-2 TaxID=3120356 RepID=UPI002FCE670A